jgi:hypothetical protein
MSTPLRKPEAAEIKVAMETAMEVMLKMKEVLQMRNLWLEMKKTN